MNEISVTSINPAEPTAKANQASQLNERPAIAALRQQLVNGQLSSVQLVQESIAAATKYQGLNALACSDFDTALALAHSADDQFARLRSEGRAEESPPLLGLPITIKDLFSVAGMPTRAGTLAPLPSLGEGDALLVSRLRAAGAIILGKTNMVEIAMGATGENSNTGDVLNPFDTSRQAGGSSSGSAVAVATGIGVASVGSDTAGSVRAPASFCGVVGFKPSYGSIPLQGGLFLSPSFDHAGPLTRSVADARLLYGIMAGRIPRQFSIQRPPTFGLFSQWHRSRLHPAIADAMQAQIERLRARGAQFVEFDSSLLNRGWEFYTPIARAEAATVHRDALRSNPKRFSPTIRAGLEHGAKVTAVEYLQAQTLRSQIRTTIDGFLKGCDALLLPTSAIPVPKRGQINVEVANNLQMATRDAVLGQTLFFSCLGLPAISLPIMQAKPDDGEVSMPAGLQLVGSHFRDDLLLSLSEWVIEG